MALPSIIRKIEEIRKKILPSNEEAIIKLSAECVRLSNRIVLLELSGAPGSYPVGGNVTINNLLGPQGYQFIGGTRIAPLTLARDGDIIPPGAAMVFRISDVPAK